FEAGAADALDAIGKRVAAQGLPCARFEDDPTGESGVAFVDPDGIRIKVRLPRPATNGSLRASDVRPRRLGHVNLKVPEPPRSAGFYGDTLALKLTEQLGDMLFFLRVGSDHHNLAFRPTPGSPNVHHVAFEVPGWESFRVICDHMAARGHQIEYGPGRHAPGHQLFMYLTDPSSGLRLEVFADMAHIDDDESYTPIRRDVDRRRSLNVWGPAPPPSFLE
ncbi:MAG: VOC family protein, partial [Acidimicrobiia bacterium]